MLTQVRDALSQLGTATVGQLAVEIGTDRESVHAALPYWVNRGDVRFLKTHTPSATNLSLMSGGAGVNDHHTSVTLLGSYVLYLVLMPVYLTIFLHVSTG